MTHPLKALTTACHCEAPKGDEAISTPGVSVTPNLLRVVGKRRRLPWLESSSRAPRASKVMRFDRPPL
jgi:hypothetical protein